MSAEAETLRRAAALMRSEHAVNDSPTECLCGDSDHWFDRSICPEPCGSMHDICVSCSRIKGRCAVTEVGRDRGNRLATTWLAVATWLDAAALVMEVAPDRHRGMALAVARAYLGEAS